MNIKMFTVIVLFAFVALYFWLGHSRRSLWFARLRQRDRKAFSRLVEACNGNEQLARKILAHERLLDERATEHQAIMRAVGTIENYRKRGIK